MALTGTDLLEQMTQAGIAPEIVARLKSDLPLLKQGVDSVDYPAFVLAVEEAHGVSISDEDSLRLRTLDDFAAHINRMKASA